MMGRNFFKGDHFGVEWKGLPENATCSGIDLIVMKEPSEEKDGVPCSFTVYPEGIQRTLYNVYMAGRSHGLRLGQADTQRRIQRALGI